MKVFGMIRRAKRFSHPDKLVKILRGMRRIIVIFTLLLTPAVMWAQAAGQHVQKKKVTTISKNKTQSSPHKTESRNKMAEEEAAKNLSGEKLDEIGLNFYFGRNGKSKNLKKAVQYFRWSAEKGYSNGQFNLGCMYYFGRDVAKDYVEAYKWFSKSAEQGNADGQNNLGLMYANGQYVNKDVLQACHWYQKAAKQGHKEAKKNLFELLREALLLPQSSVKITLVADEGWEVTKDGLLYDHYAWHNDLDVTFNLEKEATVSFDWSIERSYEDNEVITDMELFVDNSDSPLWQIGACVKSTISDHVTLTLGPGKHTLKWRPSYVGKFRIKNLLIL